MDRLKSQDEDQRGSSGLDVEEFNAFKTLKDESRIVGRAVGLWT